MIYTFSPCDCQTHLFLNIFDLESNVNDEQGIIDQLSDVYQRTSWDKSHISISYLLLSLNDNNIGIVKKELIQHDLLRFKELFSHYIIQGVLHPTHLDKNSNVYAALIAVINLVIPEIGKLVLDRSMGLFKLTYHILHENIYDYSKFIGYLISHGVADTKVAVELVTHVFEREETLFSVEIVLTLLEICGKQINRVFKKWLNEIFDKIHNFINDELNDDEVDNSLNLRILKLRKTEFKFTSTDFVPNFDYQITHFLTIDSVSFMTSNPIEYRFDPEIETNEKMYKNMVSKLLHEYDAEEEYRCEFAVKFTYNFIPEQRLSKIIRQINKIEIDINVVSLKKMCLRTFINTMLDSSIVYKGFYQKFMMIPGQEMDICFMLLDCCCKRDTYEDDFGLLAKKFCETNNLYIEMMKVLFLHSYVNSYKFDSLKSSIIAEFFAHLIIIDVLPINYLAPVGAQLDSPNRTYAILLAEAVDYRYHNRK
ncbi:pre-mRNA-splicing factor CWC22 homolog [Melanaphis sacchari]|uniref:pre-mRNA-splicing factor CWC22 homolog n=1 Tax=Melanaphis sacchari TaxID=742174 RepID=UPI000DC15A64|nr:pre-mRNA-splicing factor CWC22 homolog [Melanaphis sacchari]